MSKKKNHNVKNDNEGNNNVDNDNKNKDDDNQDNDNKDDGNQDNDQKDNNNNKDNDKKELLYQLSPHTVSRHPHKYSLLAAQKCLLVGLDLIKLCKFFTV